MAPPRGDTGGPDPSTIFTIFAHAWHKTMLFCGNPHLGDLGPPWATLVVQVMLQIAIQTEVTRGCAVSELSSDVPKLTLATCPTPWVDFACLTSSMLPYET